jgi:biotin carboxylase
MMEHVGFVEMSSTGAGELAVAYARRAGYQVSVFSRTPELTGLSEANVINCETNDSACILAAAAGLRLTAVTTTHDFYVPQTADLACALSLPGLAPQAARDARSKVLMREKLAARAPHLNPRWIAAPVDADARAIVAAVGVPLVAKPANANDSWGVARLGSVLEVSDYLYQASTWQVNSSGQPLEDLFLFEEYLDGPEYSVDTVQPAAGARVIMGVAGKPIQHKQAHFAEAEDIFPVTDTNSDMAREAAETALDALGLTVGAAHTEVRISAGHARILEINPRLAGDMVGSHMIALATGANPIEHIVEIALGRRPHWVPSLTNGSAGVGVAMPQDGRFLGLLNRSDVINLPGVAEVREMVQRGVSCSAIPRHNGDFPVRVITSGRTPQAALELARHAAAQVQMAYQEDAS